MLLWGGTTYIYYFQSFQDAKPVPPLRQNPGDATGQLHKQVIYIHIKQHIYTNFAVIEIQCLTVSGCF